MLQKSSQGLGDGSASPAYMFSEKFDETGISFAQNPAEPDESCTVSFKTRKSAKDFASKLQIHPHFTAKFVF